MNKAKEIISIKDLCVNYDGFTVLDGITLPVYENDFLGIIGPNGGGKTTLLKVILGLIRPSSGQVSIMGKTPVDARSYMGYVPQFSLHEHDFPINIWDVVILGRLSRKKWFEGFDKKDKEATERALRVVNMLDLKDRQIDKLSMGQRQRVFIARALVSEPKILLLDEPTASVDEPMQTDIYEFLKNLKNKITLIMVSHDVGVMSSYVDKIACLNCKFFYHGDKEISQEILEATYKCNVDLIGHGVPHRVMRKH
ncbi:MAG: metal ABC transporter ATP-binding protein [Candidatus Omnitrophica bacterium]|nr:metal ABC transporter ATP-binding protein [Candidatus Omnitrophota bacterium]